MSDVRTLLFPLGFVASLFFSARFFHQWIKSEKLKKSIVTTGFWRLSLAGHCIFALHSFLQFQIPVCLIQTLNGVIAWRNLNLLKKSPLSTRKTGQIALFSLLLSAVALLIQSIVTSNWVWMNSPKFLFAQSTSLSFGWHLWGFFGICLFSSRFWIQWILAEKRQKSELPLSFWWISVCGGIVSLLYFLRLKDSVNILGFGLGLIPSIRNLFLLKASRNKKTSFQDSIFIFAGEQSGDQLGADLLISLKKQFPSKRYWGVGGAKMQKVGFSSILPLEAFQVMGFSSVFIALPRLLKNYFYIKQEVLKVNPRCVICIDSPDFTLRLEKGLRKSGYKGALIHYVCPSIWAWRQNRKKGLIQNLDALLCILPFEKEHFINTSLPTFYVGHPLTTEIESHPYEADWKKLYHVSNKKILSLFPGSRKHVIETNLPLLLESIQHLENLHAYTICISVARPAYAPLIESLVEKASLSNVCFIACEHRFEQMKDTSLALAVSGTINLELALHQVPTVVIYKVSGLNYFLGKNVFRINLSHVSLPNLILKQTLFPEFIGKHLDPKLIGKAASSLLESNATFDLGKRLKTLMHQQGNVISPIDVLSPYLKESFIHEMSLR